MVLAGFAGLGSQKLVLKIGAEGWTEAPDHPGWMLLNKRPATSAGVRIRGGLFEFPFCMTTA